MRLFQLLAFISSVSSFPPIAPFRNAYFSRDHFIFATEKENQENQATPQREILDQLDAAYNYEGRLPSRGEDHRCGFVCIVGAPNMGKSTIMNALLNEELCVATRRPQTTRHAILGVLTEIDTQLLLVDTPGVIEKPAYKLQEGMMEAVMGAFYDADVLLVVTDLFSTPIPDDSLFRRVQESQKPIVVVINKIDLIDRVNKDSEENSEERTVTVEEAVARWRFLLPKARAVIPLTAAKGCDDKGITTLRKILLGSEDVAASLRNLGRPIAGMFPENEKTITSDAAKKLLPIGPPLYEEDSLTDRPERFFCSEIIRASLFQNLKKEVPYCCEVQIKEFKEPGKENGKILIAADVVVERDSQKGIVIGKGGTTIKKVGIEARDKLEDFLQSNVNLKLNVVVDKDWRKNEKTLKKFGYMR